MEIVTGNLRVVVGQDGQVTQLAPGEKPPGADDAVFVCKPVAMAFAMRGPVGESESDAARQRGAAFLTEVLEEHVVGWENVMARNAAGKLVPAEFDVGHLISGVIPPTVGVALASWLVSRASAGRIEAREGNGRSGTSRNPRPRSGGTGAESRTAEAVTSNA